MPVHIQNHHISRNLVCFQVCHDITIILCRIRSILTIPISKYIIGRQRNFSCNLSIIGHSLFVIVAITKKISIHSMFVSTGCPPGIPHLIIINESIRTSSISTRSCPGIINHCPSRARDQTILHLTALTVTHQAIQCSAGTLQILWVRFAWIPNRRYAMIADNNFQIIG